MYGSITTESLEGQQNEEYEITEDDETEKKYQPDDNDIYKYEEYEYEKKIIGTIETNLLLLFLKYLQFQIIYIV